MHRERLLPGLQEGVAVAQALLGLQAGAGLGQRHHLVLQRACGRRRRRLAGQTGMDDRSQRIQVRPRALPQAGHLGVLLDRRVVRLQDRGERLRAVADDLACGAEVQQHRPAVAQQQDVVRRDVAVVDVLGMQRLEGAQQRHQHAHQPDLAGRRRHLAQCLRQRLALVERHHHVGGAVAFPVAEDLDQRRMVEAREHLRLEHEAAQPGAEGLAMRASARLHRAVVAARGQQSRHVFLDRHLALEVVVEGPVDDAEAADADQAADLELAQPGADAQGAFFVHAVCPSQELGGMG